MSLSTSGRTAQPFRTGFAFAVRHWRRQPGRVLALTAAVIGATLADLLIPMVTGHLVDVLVAGTADRPSALRAAIEAVAVMTVLAAGMIGLRWAAYQGIVDLTLRMMQDVGQDAFRRVQRFSTDWHANSFAGSTVRKITRGMWGLDLLNDTVLLAMLPGLVVLVGAAALLGWHWPLMGLIVGIGTVGYVLMATLLSLYYVAPSARLSNAWDTRIGGALADAVSCNAVVKAFGAEAREDARFTRVVDKWYRRTFRTWTRGTLNGTAQGAALVVLRVAVFAAILWLWWRERASPGDVVYVVATYGVIAGYLRDIGMHIRNLQRSINDMEELVELDRQPKGVADRAQALPIAIGGGRIEFQRVTFHYGGHATPLYRDFSVTIGAGERVGLVGHSGSGKTTVVKLIQRLYDLNEGRILIDGQDIARATQASLRSQIAIVQQEPILFHRSLAENIAYARPGAAMGEIETAARLANAHEFIARLPKGYGTLVGERGVKLSGGERQRVALARAFLADAPILILDEATSSLDSELEALIQEAMERLIRGRTALVIAHRLSTVRALDRILVFDRGRIVEEGNHATLIRTERGIYRRLFERQALELTKGLVA